MPRPKKYHVTLTEEERAALTRMIANGTALARTLTHARILLKADENSAQGAWTDAAIAQALEVRALTVARVRQRFALAGLAAALQRKEQSRRKPRKLDGAQEAHLIALVCSPAPDGQQRWSLRLLAQKMVELGHVEELSYETVRQVLKRGN